MRRTAAGRRGAATLISVVLIAASSYGAVVPPTLQLALPATSTGQLMAYGGRSAEQLRSVSGRKLDAALADLSRHANRVRPGREMQDLHSMNPAARFTLPDDAIPRVAVDVVTRGDPQQLKAALIALGLQHPSVYANDVGGWLPVNAITAAAERAEVVSLRAAMSRSRAAAPIAEQGDFTQGSAALRTTYSTLDGAGVTVGILSDSFNCYGVYDQPGSGVPAGGAQGYAPFGFATDDAKFDESNGYLTASVKVLEEATCLHYGQPLLLPFTDEGRAMLQIVHVVAPGAALDFYTSSNNEADFANGIGALAAAGATVIADDTGYFDEPFFQDGIVAQAVDAVAAKGVVYFSAAGNNGKLSYESTTPAFSTLSTSGPNQGESLLNFNTAGSPVATSLPVTIPALLPGEFLAVVVEWDQPYVTGAAGSPGASSRIDLCVSGASKYTVVNLDGQPVSCTGPNASGSDAVQVLILGNPANASGGKSTATQTVDLEIGLVSGTPAPGRIKLVVEDDGLGSTIDSYATNSATLQGHPGAAGAAAVAAAFFPDTPLCGTTPAVLEKFSAQGGDPILFDTSGKRLATPQVRQKPDVTGPDGVNTSFFGFFIEGTPFVDNSTVAGCQNDASYLNFFGTSAATPHAAGVAALARQAIPSLTPTQIVGAMQATAAPMGDAAPNFESGYGFIQAAKLAAPVIWFPAGTVSVGNTTTLSWLDLEATSCTTSWGGAQTVFGTQQVTPTAVGSATYTLTCVGSAGTQNSSVTLQAVPTLGVSSTALPTGQVGMAYSATLSATGGVVPYGWSLVGGALPAGLSLNGASGKITGTPTSAVSAAALTFQVTDAEVPAFSKTANLSLTIAAAPSPSGSGSGGGGALDAATVLALSGTALVRLLRSARRGRAPLA